MTSNSSCLPCSLSDIQAVALKYCSVCEEYLCKKCVVEHSLRKATKNHRPSLINQENQSNYQTCEQCREGQKKLTAIKFCNDCKRFLCEVCSNVHINDETTKDHCQMDLSDQEYEAIQSDEGLEERKRYGKGRESQEREAFTGDDDERRMDRPGKPKQEHVQLDSVTVSWAPIEKFQGEVYYQVCYRMSGNDSQWVICQDQFEYSYVSVSSLKSNTEFIFRVRAVTTHGEGPYSEESQTIKTLESAAAKWRTISMPLSGRSFLPAIYALPLVNESDARNEIAKTKRCKLGDDTFRSSMSRTIMLVGATGTGKSTFVDGLINYIMGVQWEDDFRLTIIDKEQVPVEKRGNEAFSQTDWITCYTVNPKPGSRLDYQLNIIDTPGFGDTSGIERDRNIVEQVRKLFTESEPKGVKFIDAVCFLLKAPDARLTSAQKYIFNSIMSLFGKDIEENICSIITFADSEDAPVLAAMKESKLPFGKAFHFNNAGLFARNTNQSPANVSRIFWKESRNSFRAFFEYLETGKTKSLQLTGEVLEERYNLELFASVLTKQISESLRKNESLRMEIKVIEEHESAMKILNMK